MFGVVSKFINLIRQWVDDPTLTQKVYPILLVADLLLSILIIKSVPFTNIDFEAYMEEVHPVISYGERNYSKLQGTTGPIAYPAGFIYIYSFVSYLTHEGKLLIVAQAIFLLFHLVLAWVICQLYILAKLPFWTLTLALFSKRIHSIFLLRLFNDAISSTFAYLSILLLLNEWEIIGALIFSLAISVKIGPILYWAAFGLRLVLSGGWSNAIPKLFLIAAVQAIVGAPFISEDAGAYFSRSFGGPGNLQRVWSVNWKFLPDSLFYSSAFPFILLIVYLVLMLLFLYKKWCPQGILSMNCGIWCWRRKYSTIYVYTYQIADSINCHIYREPSLQDHRLWLALFFTCNLLGVTFLLRTMHFQFAVWYTHTIPFLCWYAIMPVDASTTIEWVFRCFAVVAVTGTIEFGFLLTKEDVVAGPTGESWITHGTPTEFSSMLITGTNALLASILFFRQGDSPVVTVLEDAHFKNA